jgi:putative Mg2+ transporter-C (MgtC) family protein
MTSILLAAALGAVIGLERAFSGKAAGLRTNILICLGAAVFTLVSRQMLSEEGSVARIAAQVVTGVGFLGAGAIIRDRGGVHGLTTAATIWLVAAIGMACGATLYLLAASVTAVGFVVLVALRNVGNHLEAFGEKLAQKESDV